MMRDADDMTLAVGDRFRSELNNAVVEITDRDAGIIRVETEDGEASWRERVDDAKDKIADGDWTPLDGDDSMTVRADVPRPAEAQLLYPDRETAMTVANELGLDGVHAHDLDGQQWYMPGSDHEAFEAAMDETTQQGEKLDECVESVLDDNPDLSESDAYAICNAELNSEALTVKAEFAPGDQVMWEYSGGEAHGVIRAVHAGSVSLPNGAEREAPPEGEANYVIDEWDDETGEWDEYSVVKSGSELDESTADLPEPPADYSALCLAADSPTQSPVGQKATFGEGDAVRWSWQGEPVHGRVAEVREQATVSGNTITGEEGEQDVYVIDEWDDRAGGYRRENVAKPETSLDESQKDLPPRSEGNYVNEQAWESLTTTVSASDFTARELDHMSYEMDGVLLKHRPNEWLLPAQDPVVYRYDIPEKYLEDRDEDFFVPNAGMADSARQLLEWAEAYPDEMDAGADDGELIRRANQIVEHHERGEPLAIEYWEEIENFHARKHAQDSHEIDSEYEGTPWQDKGYASHEGWGGDAGYEQAQRVMSHVESVDQEAAVEMRGAVATEQSVSPAAITQADSNKVDLEALDGELREAVEAEDFYIYGKASIEQWDDDHPPTYIEMDALEDALDRYFSSETAPGIISRHHQDIPVGVPVESFEFDEATTLKIDGDTYEFEAGDVARTHVEDADDDGRPELWLAANISNDNEMGKKTRVLAAQGDLNGFSVTVHRNDDEMTSEGRFVTECDLHAVTIGTDEQVKNPGSEFDVASYSAAFKRAKERVLSFVR